MIARIPNAGLESLIESPPASAFPFVSDGSWYPERHIAQERAAGRCHLYFAGGGARGYGGRDFGTRPQSDSWRRAIKVDASHSRQIGAQNFDGRSYFRGGRLGLHKWPQTYRQAEDRAVTVGPAISRCPV